MNKVTEQRIKNLQGPVLILGASGFVGANLLRAIRAIRSDAFGTSRSEDPWRLRDIERSAVISADLLVEANVKSLLTKVRPKTVFNCLSYGAYSFETDPDLIQLTNFNLTNCLVRLLGPLGIQAYIHAGSSSEYGDNSAGPLEDAISQPNSYYSVSKMASANLLHYAGRKQGFPTINLRLYSVYGPYEDPARLVPNLLKCAAKGTLPPFVRPEISRDFVHCDDVIDAFVTAALAIEPSLYGQSINIGTGTKTSMRELADLAKNLFSLPVEAEFAAYEERKWDLDDWYANIDKAEKLLRWAPRIDLRSGLIRTMAWYQSLADQNTYLKSSKMHAIDRTFSVSAVIACYKDQQAIPIMYERLSKVFKALTIDYEIIFVNDCSPDSSEEEIQKLSASDPRVLGISHSRNFGSQAAFLSGMGIASKNACVLLDGDLQDPPELIVNFVNLWRQGFEVVYGRRVDRQAPLHMRFAYKLFYRIFDAFSYIPIPRDAGDFSLMDRKVVDWLLQFPERDVFLRGLRAYAGFRQTNVDYIRPERMFGRSTNNLFKNLGWAKKGILAFSDVPLSLVTATGVALFFMTVLLGTCQILFHVFFPELTPKGITTLLLVVFFFGSINLLAISIVGEYISKITHEVKRRPHFIRKHLIKDGGLRKFADALVTRTVGL